MRYYVKACPNHTSNHMTRLSVRWDSAHECAQLKTTLFVPLLLLGGEMDEQTQDIKLFDKLS